MMTTEAFLSSLAALQFDHTFNPYTARCPVCDHADAPQQRSATLLRMLEAAQEAELDSIWIGRDLGYRGGRRTGLALTDDVHIDAHASRWGFQADRPTRGDVVAERTAATIWRVLAQIREPVFLWNVFPLHPHEPDEPFTNRAHNARERNTGEEILLQLIALLAPRRLIAVGNDAAKTAHRLARNEEVARVRHPSYGGQREFLKQVTTLYELPKFGC